ncbi:hypothetical protein BGZ83_004843 [Gryganskiella cystojenkinii]|nr:hypothetical protein BGZ83_004843 [Gryganskiella cystojenkinii]
MTVLEPLLRPILESCPDLRVLKVTGFQRDRSEESLVPTPALGVLAHPPSSPDAINGEANETNNISIDSNGGVNRRFLTRLAQWCPRLESIQLSQRDTLSSPSDIRLLLKFFPQVHSLGFSTRDVLPSIFSELRVQETITNAPQSPQSPSSSSLPTPQLRPRTVLNTITTLEICPSQSAFEEATLNKVLHEFLCDSPQLLHLKAEHVQFYVEYFDILPRHDRSDLEEQLRGSGSGGAGDGNDSDGEGAAMTNASSEAVSGTIIPQPSQEQLLQLQNMPRTRIWACRKLQTLHISLKSMSTSTALLPGTTLRTSFPFNKRSSSSPDQSRAIFGYLSRVLPLLRDLALSKSRLNLTLEGGFCLLTRMRDLEKLTLQIRKPPRPVPDNTIGGSGSSSSPSTPPCLFKERDFNWLVRTPSPWQIVKWSLQGPIGMDSNSSNNKHRNSSNYKQDSLATTVERKTVRTKLSGLFNPSSTSVMPLEAPRRKSDGDTIDAALKGKSRSDIATRTRAATTTTVSPAPSSITTTTSSASAGSARLHQDERRVLTSGSSTLGIKFLRRTQSSRQPLRAQTKKSHSQPVEHDEGENRNDITTATSPTNDDNLEQEQERQQSLDALSLIQFLGQDKDIKAALRERALDYRVGCWSKLEQLTIYFVESWDSDLSSLEKIIRRMRPEIQFSSMFMSGL